VSSQFIAEDNEFEIDSYVVFDAAVYYSFGDWDLSLNLKNLTDEEYETRGFGSTSVIPASEFAAYGAVQYRF
jgi:iron complex outermembrane receptor protein